MNTLERLISRGVDTTRDATAAEAAQLRKVRFTQLAQLARKVLGTEDGKQLMVELTNAIPPGAASFEFNSGVTCPLKAAHKDGARDVIATLCLLSNQSPIGDETGITDKRKP